jgi:hypothetical protein
MEPGDDFRSRQDEARIDLVSPTMRFFAIICYAIALYYGYTAVETMWSGVAYAMRGDTATPHHRDAADSKYGKYLMARWMFAGGFIALGAVMQVFAARFEKLENDAVR